MDLEFSEEEAALRDNVRSVLERISSPSTVRAVFEGGEAPPETWERMVELYWPGLAIAEEFGGLGMGFVDVAIVAEELGRAVVASPFLATVTQFVPIVASLGSKEQQARWLTGVASGGRTGTVALAEDGRWEFDTVAATAVPHGNGWLLSGVKDVVLDGATADEIAVVARGADTSASSGLGVFVVPGADLSARAVATIDPTMPLARVSLDGVIVPADRVLAEPNDPNANRSLRLAVEEATVAVAIATAGTCRVIFESTLAYLKVREQYGRPIGSFQALKHRAVDMYLAVERATSLCYYAALMIAEDDPGRSQAVSMAKAASGECQRLIVQEGLQLHGGVGYTWEHDLHFWLKRAKTGDALFGNAANHRTRLAAMLGLIEDGRAA